MKSFLSWSSGKDAAFTLVKLIEMKNKPDLLLTTVNKDFDRVSMHGVRIELLEQQAKSLGINLYKIPLSKNVDMKSYNLIMNRNIKKLKNQDFDIAVFGDIFLEDLKEFRTNQMKKLGIKSIFPLWKTDTKKLAKKIIDVGIKAKIVSADAKLLGKDFVGREFDFDFLNDLPENVDWCGENGEFHTFVYEHPYFKFPIDFYPGEKIYKKFNPCSKADKNSYKTDTTNSTKKWNTGFWFIDIISR